MTEGPVCLLFTGVLVDELTGRDEAARIRFCINDTSIDMDVWAHGTHTDHTFPAKSIGLRLIHGRCFGPVPDGYVELDVETDTTPINLDGSPRNKVIDELRRRWPDGYELRAAD